MRAKWTTIQQIVLGSALLLALCWNLAQANEIKGLQLSGGATGTRAELQLQGKVTFRTMTLSNPDRFVVDLPDTAPSRTLQLPAPTGIIKAVRSGKPTAGTTRIVFDLASPVAPLKPRIELGAGRCASGAGMAGRRVQTACDYRAPVERAACRCDARIDSAVTRQARRDARLGAKHRRSNRRGAGAGSDANIACDHRQANRCCYAVREYGHGHIQCNRRSDHACDQAGGYRCRVACRGRQGFADPARRHPPVDRGDRRRSRRPGSRRDRPHRQARKRRHLGHRARTRPPGQCHARTQGSADSGQRHVSALA